MARLSLSLLRSSVVAGAGCGSGALSCPRVSCSARAVLAGAAPRWSCPAPWGVPSPGPSRFLFRLAVAVGLALVPVRRLRAALAARLSLVRFAVAACAVSLAAARRCAFCSRAFCPRRLRSLPGGWARLPWWGSALPGCARLVVWSPLFLRACRLLRLLPAARAAALARVPVRGSLGSCCGGA